MKWNIGFKIVEILGVVLAISHYHMGLSERFLKDAKSFK